MKRGESGRFLPVTMMRFDFAIIGGDKRTAYMVPIFMEKGYRVVCYQTVNLPYDKTYYAASLKEALDQTQVVVAGIPFVKNDCIFCEEQTAEIRISDFQRCLRKHQKIFGGVIPETFRRTCEEREIGCYDFMKDEPLTLYNAISTAEGAILEAMLHKACNLHQSQTLVLGYGRCGKVLADKLKGLSACVTVCSNNEQELALACALGFDTLHLSRLVKCIGRFTYIFNTIPACVLTKPCLANLRRNTIVIDIASNQIGADYEAAKLMNTHICFCPGLPGKYAGESCAAHLVDYVLKCCGRKK